MKWLETNYGQWIRLHVFCKDDTYLCRAIATFLPDEIRPSLSRKQLSNFAPRHTRYMCVHANAIFPRSFSFPLLQLSFYRRKRSFDARSNYSPPPPPSSSSSDSRNKKFKNYTRESSKRNLTRLKDNSKSIRKFTRNDIESIIEKRPLLPGTLRLCRNCRIRGEHTTPAVTLFQRFHGD